MSVGVTGNTSGFGPEEWRFEPFTDNKERKTFAEILDETFHNH